MVREAISAVIKVISSDIERKDRARGYKLPLLSSTLRFGARMANKVAFTFHSGIKAHYGRRVRRNFTYYVRLGDINNCDENLHIIRSDELFDFTKLSRRHFLKNKKHLVTVLDYRSIVCMCVFVGEKISRIKWH